MSEEQKPKPIRGYQYAVVHKGKSYWLIPTDMTFRDAFAQMFGDPYIPPDESLTIAIPETLPVKPAKEGEGP